MLVLWTDRTISLSRREARQENDAMLARLEKVLIRADELHRTLAQQGCEFSIFPSPAAFELCLDQAKKSGGVLEEGDWDLNRGAESRVWRSIEPQLGYWIRTSFFDMFERKDKVMACKGPGTYYEPRQNPLLNSISVSLYTTMT